MDNVSSQIKRCLYACNFKKIRFTIIYILLLIVSNVYAQNTGAIQIGAGSATLESGPLTLPVTNYNYSYTQQLVSSLEYTAGGGVSGSITKLRYRPTNVGDFLVWQNVTVLIGNTTKAQFTSNTDWVPFNQLTQVFNGIISPSPLNNQWFEIVFNTPFNYTGGNLVIAVQENSLGWSNGPTFSTYTSTNNSGIVWRSDDGNINPATDFIIANGGRTNQLPQIQFEGAVADCLSPTNIQVLPTINGGSVSWNNVTNADDYSWIVVENNAGPSAIPLASGIETQLSAVITGLNPATDYDFYIKTNCSTGDVSQWSLKIDFSTACAPLINTFFQDFDSTQIGDNENSTFPNCWNFISPENVLWSSGYGFVTDYSAYSNLNSFYMFSLFDVDDLILVSPETLNLGEGAKQLRFMAKTNSVGAELIVGTMSNQNLASTFLELPNGTIQLSEDFLEYIIPLPSGTNDYFAFKHGMTDLYQEIFIDNVYYEDIPNCQGVNTGSLTASQISYNQAILSWESLSNNFDIEYGEVDFQPGSGTIISDVSNNFLLSNLNHSTAYSYYVRSNCEENGLSAWMGPYNFQTQVVVSSPWFEGFASTEPNGFNNSGFSLSNDLSSLLPASNYFYYKNIYSEDTSNGNIETINVGPILQDDAFSFKYNFAAWATDQVVNDDEGAIEIKISTDYGFTYTTLAIVSSNGIDGWQNFQVPLNQYVGEFVKFKLIGNWNSDLYGDFYLGLDNLYVGSCDLPNTPEVQTSTVNSVTLFLEANSTDEFQIEYGLNDFVQGSGTVINVTGSVHTITDLLPATIYDYYIRKVCDDTNKSAWVGKYNFSTACNVFEEGFTENFDSTTVGNSQEQTIPICWSFIGDAEGYGYVYDSDYISSPNSFYFNNNDDNANSYILISPETQNLGNGNYRVTFKAKGGSDNYKLKFGTMSDKLNPATFVELQEFTLSSNYQSFIVYLPVGTNDFFAFKHGLNGSYRSIFIDDVVYETIPDCVPPINLNVTKNLSNSTAQLSWEGPEIITNNNFEVEWGIAGFSQGSGTLVNASDYSINISNLNLDESYSFYVRRLCDNDNTEWIGPFIFDMDYCSSVPTSNDDLGITNIIIAGVIIPVDDVTYADFTNTQISLNAGQLVQSFITFSTGYSYDTNIWIDLNKDGVFDNANELFFSGTSLPDANTILNTSFNIPNNGDFFTDEYRIRVGSADSGQSPPNSCYSGDYGVTLDLKATINFPCIIPSNINFIDVGTDYVTLDWTGQEDGEYEIEYGLTGFVQGQGIVMFDVSKPYTISNLNSGSVYDFYIRKRCGDQFSEWSSLASEYIYCNTLQPTGSSLQTLIEGEFLSQLEIEGQNLKFYTDVNLNNEVPATTAVQSNSTYFVTQTINCESDSYLIVQVNVIPRIAQPIVNINQNFCDGGLISDISISALPNTTIAWYSSLTSQIPLSLDTPLQTGSYYVTQTDGVTTSYRLLINVVVNPTPINLQSQTINLCGNSTFGNLSVNNLPGTTVKWYASVNSTIPINSNVLVSTGIYYVTQSFGLCESQKIMIQISQAQALNKPQADTQFFCGSGTVGQLVAQGVQGAQFIWYSSATSTQPLSQTTNLVTGTYYVAQSINGCLSDRKAVAVRIVSITPPQIAPFLICGAGFISDLYIPASADITYKWYNSPTSTNELSQATSLVNGTYYVERIQNGCTSSRAAVQVIIGNVPNAPTGNQNQSFVEGSAISNLILNQNNVVWYNSYNDSQNGVNSLPLNSPLVNGKTYYAVIIGSNGCPSLPFAVVVDVYLSSTRFVLDDLKYYPNPVIDVLRIDYVETIKSVEVFDLLGKRVKYLSFENENIQIDLSELSSGNYIIQLKTETKAQFIKVIKK